MIFIRRVTGESMTPTLRSGQLVICHQIRDFRVGQIVVAFVDGNEVIKRISKINDGKIYLSVDDKNHAHNGKYYAVVSDSKIEGIVFWPRNL
jgi:phage repressor protein C with HTH and peptisase S24 domain